MLRILSFFLLLSSVSAFAQTAPQRVEMKKVKKAVSDESSEYYWPKLLARYKAYDSTMTLEHYRMFYYGFAFNENYSAFQDEKSAQIKAAMDKKDYLAGLRTCDSVLDKYPVMLRPNYMKAVLLRKWGNDSLAEKCYARYKKLAEAILSTGNGMSCKTGFKVLFIGDEYSIMYGELDIESMQGQALASPCDILSVTPSEKFKSSSLYFDAEEILKKEEEMFKK